MKLCAGMLTVGLFKMANMQQEFYLRPENSNS